MSLVSRYAVARDDARDFSSNPDFFSAPYHQHAAPDAATRPRPDMAGRRESRLGLRSIFGRNKALKADAPPSRAHRASLAQLGQWPNAHHSDAALPTSPTWRQPPATPQRDDASLKRRRPALKSSRDSLAGWSMPPLFKAFPQAVRHITLPAATMPADAILRLNEKRNGGAPHEGGASRDGELDKKRHRRNASVSAEKLEWTAKIYILVTSGYVLQYAGDGHFDRLPEKVLRLGPSSAAFASDAIPGRHWVVHVSSTAQADGTVAPESRSLLSKLPFRVDRRASSNLLMVFEGADVMETWITTLRSEIEKLGGKKNLSETGGPKADEASSHQLKGRPSQRTLIVRDLSRFGRNRRSQAGATPATEQQPGAWDGEAPPRVVGGGGDAARDKSLDGGSTTNSVVSHDGRQLDKLRESAHRLSYISSGQRTVVTSAGSSPATSPTRDDFGSPGDEAKAARRREHGEGAAARPRPNAADMCGRRQSTQQTAVGPREPGAAAGHEAGGGRGEGVASPTGCRSTPNFSLPHAHKARHSYARTQPTEHDEAPQDGHARSARGRPAPPPPSLRGAARPLSMVVDQPSPRETAPERPMTSHRTRRQPSAAAQRADDDERLRSASRGRRSLHGDGAAAAATKTRRLEPPPGDDAAGTQRSSSLLDAGGGPRSRSVEPSRAAKRASTNSIMSEASYEMLHHQLLAGEAAGAQAAQATAKGHAGAGAGAGDARSRAALFSRRRSMPQLADGPPPAPPPTRALPPIPQKMQLRA